MIDVEISENRLANYNISVERIKQAFRFLQSEDEQFVVFGSQFVIRVEKHNYDMNLVIFNKETEKYISRIIAGSEMDSAKFDIVTIVVHWMIGKLESKITI